MNPAALLSLISDLYSQIMQLSQENAALREQLSAPPADKPVSP